MSKQGSSNNAEEQAELGNEDNRTEVAAVGVEKDSPLTAALDRLMIVLNEASEERYQNLREWERLAREWQSKGDGYGYNFHQGMAAGANWCDIYYRRVGREIETILKEALVKQEKNPSHQASRKVNPARYIASAIRALPSCGPADSEGVMEAAREIIAEFKVGTNHPEEIAAIISRHLRPTGEDGLLTLLEVKHLQECHETKTTHAIGCAIDMKRRGEWGTKQKELRPTPDSGEQVEVALRELRNMFPRHCINLTWSLGVAAGQQVTIHLINPEANGTAWGDHRFSRPTLADAMIKAREYYDDGMQADIDARQAALGQ